MSEVDEPSRNKNDILKDRLNLQIHVSIQCTIISYTYPPLAKSGPLIGLVWSIKVFAEGRHVSRI
jgi:hypothetical protein